MIRYPSHYSISALIRGAALLTILIVPGMADDGQSAKMEPLAFETKTVELVVESGRQTADISFRFQNYSPKTVEIASLQAACSCILAALKDGRKIYKPGETGEVAAQFSVGNLTGVVEKQLLVRLKGDAKDNPPIVLNAKITIPELVEIVPRTLNWEAGEAPTPKSQKIRILHKEPIRITGVVTTNNHFQPILKTLREGAEYEITITPKDTSETSFGILKITTNSTLARYRNLSAFALVQKTGGKNGKNP